MSYVSLSGIVDIENVKITVKFLANIFGFLTGNCQLELFDKTTRTDQVFDVLLFFTQGVYVSIIPCKKRSQYYLADSYAQDTERKPDANGSGIIIKFEDVLELSSCIS